MNEQHNPHGQGFWKEHSELWKVSGLTQQSCTREGISYQSFVYRHNRANSKLKKLGLKSGKSRTQFTTKPRYYPRGMPRRFSAASSAFSSLSAINSIMFAFAL
jgi:hypothetical protein